MCWFWWSAGRGMCGVRFVVLLLFFVEHTNSYVGGCVSSVFCYICGWHWVFFCFLVVGRVGLLGAEIYFKVVFDFADVIVGWGGE